eukprot:TRINITY_DN19792_c0_g1_i1.p1 TRINITY_DN19792_c0_g1~~TRINITY_DN19792_c0_g1_i1.p1  ORF type:complete len:163 (+),score=22.53 TRINITY_DN19792_c0_g1_i1:372-860(+)
MVLLAQVVVLLGLQSAVRMFCQELGLEGLLEITLFQHHGKVSQLTDARVCVVAGVHILCEGCHLLGAGCQASLLDSIAALLDSVHRLMSEQPAALPSLGGAGYATAVGAVPRDEGIDLVPVQDLGVYVGSQIKKWQMQDQRRAQMVVDQCCVETNSTLSRYG